MNYDLQEGRQKLVRLYRFLQPLLYANMAGTALFLLLELVELSGIYDPYNVGSEGALYSIVSFGVAVTVLNIVTIIIFAMWIYRAAANIYEADIPGFEYTPGWCVGWYFIPIANLFMPFQAMRQIWNASHGNFNDLKENSNILIWWWITWIVGGIANQIAFRLSEGSSTALTFGVAGSAITIACHVLAIQLTRSITRSQTETEHLSAIFE
ncbi:MAG: DUF4328 domain-containing protein [Pseudomonadota bacterium]